MGYILVTEQANDILFAVDERKNFIIRTVLAVALVIGFSLSLFSQWLSNKLRKKDK